MLAGALVGAVLVIHAQIVYPFVIALVAVASVVLATHALAASRPAWATSGRG
jgi:hypothetical protein